MVAGTAIYVHSRRGCLPCPALLELGIGDRGQHRLTGDAEHDDDEPGPRVLQVVRRLVVDDVIRDWLTVKDADRFPPSGWPRTGRAGMESMAAEVGWCVRRLVLVDKRAPQPGVGLVWAGEVAAHDG